MIVNGHISILNNIIIDKQLPKHKKVETNKNNFDGTGSFVNVSGANPSDSFSIRINARPRDNYEYLEYLYANSHSFFIKFKMIIYKLLYNKYFNTEKIKDISYIQLKNFFDSIKSGVTLLNTKDVEEVLEKYFEVLNNAQSNNQTALVEIVKDYAEVLKYELVLSQSKFNNFLSEEDIVRFYNVASKHERLKTKLCLTYVKNFIKIIPDEITKLKQEADELKVFDNYVILHYDYDGKAVDDTKEEKQKKKDPILFGVINNSKKLYYIGDWVDDYCDLTLDVIIKKLGKKAKPGVLDSETIKNDISHI